jgi:hypothetical protein
MRSSYAEGQDWSSRELNLVSDFLQLIVVRGVAFRSLSPKANRSNAPDCVSEAPEMSDPNRERARGAVNLCEFSPSQRENPTRGPIVEERSILVQCGPSATQAGGVEELVIFEISSLTSACI